MFFAHTRDDAFWGLVSCMLCAGAFYGVQKRAPVTWKLGFVWIVVSGCLFLVRALSDEALRNLDRRIAIPFLIIVTIMVSAYWSQWWYGKKDYFSRPEANRRG